MYSTNVQKQAQSTVSAYTASDNAPTRTRFWSRKTRLLNFMPSALPCGQFNPIASVLLSKPFSAPVLQFITWIPVMYLLTIHHVSTSSNHKYIYYHETRQCTLLNSALLHELLFLIHSTKWIPGIPSQWWHTEHGSSMAQNGIYAYIPEITVYNLLIIITLLVFNH